MNNPKIPTAKSPGKIMEAPRPLGGRIQRKPLADCTNIVSRSSQQSSSSVKFANPSLTSSLKRLVDQTTLKEKLKDVNTSEAASENASQSLSTNVRPVTLRMSSDLGTPASAPSLPETSQSDLGVSDKEVEEHRSVFTVRRKRKSSRASARVRRDLTSIFGKKTRQENITKTQPLKVAPKKRQRTVKQENKNSVTLQRQRTVKQENKNSVHAAPRDYIEQQKAYFAEIDAFELPVEEVSSDESN